MEKLLHFGINKEFKKDKKIIKEYLDLRYPTYYHDLNLEDTFDDIGMTCMNF